jgi:hypothetical protein
VGHIRVFEMQLPEGAKGEGRSPIRISKRLSTFSVLIWSCNLFFTMLFSPNKALIQKKMCICP